MSKQDILDMLTVLSFGYGVANYAENLTQSDKADLMHALDEQTAGILAEIRAELEEQNNMLAEILRRLDSDR